VRLRGGYGVVPVELAKMRRVKAGKVNIELLEEGDLAELVVFKIAGPDVGALVLVAVGKQVERLAVPHA